jgi:hypothetical protein
MTTGSSPPWGAKVALPLSAGGLPLFNSRAATSLQERSLGTSGRLIFAQPERGFLEIAALRPTRSQSRPLASPCWSGRRPATRSAENDQIRSLLALDPLDESLTRGPLPHRRSLRNANAHRFDPALEKEGRAVLRGRPLRGRHSKNTDLFGQPCDRPSHVTLPRRGLAGSGAAAALWCSRHALRGL